MPKMKTKKGAAKRFRVRGSGSTNTAAIRNMLPYSS